MVTTRADEHASDPAEPEAATAASGASASDGSGGPGGSESAAPNLLLYVAIALAVIAAACAAWFGWSWQHTTHSSSLSSAQVRDEALRQGELAVQDFNTLDYKTVGAGLDTWQKSSTGTLLHEITAGRSQFEAEIRKAKTITTASVLDAALTSLNEQTGRANIIVALQITVTPLKGSSTTKQTRLEGTLVRTASGWKLSSLGAVPVGTAGSGSGQSSSSP